MHIKTNNFTSVQLHKEVRADFYLPTTAFAEDHHLLILNDGQNMQEVGLSGILERLCEMGKIKPLVVVAVHADADRKNDYGVASTPNYLGQGGNGEAYTNFLMHELIPQIPKHLNGIGVGKQSIAGFSLGGLSALDVFLNHSSQFASVGVFSGSLWWRSISDKDPGYDDAKHKIILEEIRKSMYLPQKKLFFQCGNMDETADRNGNGIIDSIDDTMDAIEELEKLGYKKDQDIRYLEIADGKHDMATWARALPDYLQWICGK